MAAMATGFIHGTNWAFEGWWVVLAILTHAILIGGMPSPPDRSRAVAPSDLVDLSFIEEEAAPVEPAEAVKPPPRLKKLRVAKRPSPSKAPPPAQETPAAFDNVVLTDDGKNEPLWEVGEASGKSVEDPIGSPNSAVTGESKVGVVGGVIGGTGRGVVVEVGDLSREPVTPFLELRLERPDPKQLGPEGGVGEAFVRLRVSAAGVPSDWQLIAEDPPGYELGQACIDTLKREAWQAELDRNGKPITKRIIYRCGFEIRR